MTLGRRIAEAREAAGLSQTELGALIHTTQQHVSRWERDRSRPGPPALVRLADALKIPREELLGLAFAAAEAAGSEAAKERDRLAGAMQSFADRYEEFHGAYTRLTEAVEWLVESFRTQMDQLQQMDARLGRVEDRLPGDPPPD